MITYMTYIYIFIDESYQKITKQSRLGKIEAQDPVLWLVHKVCKVATSASKSSQQGRNTSLHAPARETGKDSVDMEMGKLYEKVWKSFENNWICRETGFLDIVLQLYSPWTLSQWHTTTVACWDLDIGQASCSDFMDIHQPKGTEKSCIYPLPSNSGLNKGLSWNPPLKSIRKIYQSWWLLLGGGLDPRVCPCNSFYFFDKYLQLHHHLLFCHLPRPWKTWKGDGCRNLPVP